MANNFTVTKYRNKKTIVDGIKFDSKKEASRYGILKMKQRGGYIHNLKLQVRYRLEVNGQLICKYVADFVYLEKGEYIVEDAKGFKTPVYQLKKKLMMAVHGIEIKEV